MTLKKGVRIVTYMLILVMVLSCAGVYAASGKITLKSYDAPKMVKMGVGYSIKGTIKADKTISTVTIGIVSKKTGKWTKQKYVAKNVNKKTFDVNKADNKIRFGKLSPGTYYYRIYVKLKGKKNKRLLSRKFTVKKNGTYTSYKCGTVSVTAASPAKIRLSGSNAPSSIKTGSPFSVKGTIKANKTISTVTIGIVSKKTGKWTEYKYVKKNVGKKTFDIHKADSAMRFSKLPAGTYYYRIYVKLKGGKNKQVLNRKFTVTDPGSGSSENGDNGSSGNGDSGSSDQGPAEINLSGNNAPTSIAAGSAFSIKGIIKANKNINTVTIGVVSKRSGKWTAQKYVEENVNKKSFNINNADMSIRFGQLSKGDYYYRISVKLEGEKSKRVLNKQFNVYEVNVSTPSSSSSDSPDQVGSEGIRLSGCNSPSDYNVGTGFTIRGKVKSKHHINKVEVGIVFEPTNKWTSYKYTADVDTKVFDLSEAAEKLRFDRLAGGTYRYRMYAHTDDGIRICFDKQFTVIPSKKPAKAVRWAKKIAKDDSFSYGKKPATSKVGCYFCGTNQKRKPKGYEKTYVCMTFAHAAYAHGAKDPELLAECKKGNHCLELTNANLTKYSCWMKMGSCRDLSVEDLQVGDLIVWYSDDNTHGHIAIYAGKGAIVDATSGAGDPWGPNSIAVRKGAAARYLATGAKWSKKSYVMRYRY